jgi:hypothetical protein
VGDLSTDEIYFRYTDAERTIIETRFTAWLVPFDLGVSQSVVIRTSPSEDAVQACELDMECTRLSGDYTSWKRVNLHFLKVIRKQFLIWRILKNEDKEKYVSAGRKLLEGEGDHRTTHVQAERNA